LKGRSFGPFCISAKNLSLEERATTAFDVDVCFEALKPLRFSSISTDPGKNKAAFGAGGGGGGAAGAKGTAFPTFFDTFGIGGGGGGALGIALSGISGEGGGGGGESSTPATH